MKNRRSILILETSWSSIFSRRWLKLKNENANALKELKRLCRSFALLIELLRAPKQSDEEKNKDLVDVKNYWEDLSKADIPNSLKDHWLDDDGNAVASMYKEVAEFVISLCQSNEAEILEVGCNW